MCSFFIKVLNMNGVLLTFKTCLQLGLKLFLTVESQFSSLEANLTIGLVLPYSAGVGEVRGLPGKYYASAITLAIDDINNDESLLPGIRLNFIWNDSKCVEELSIDALIYQWEKRVHAFIGFGCKCFTQARIAATLNLPIISHVSALTTDAFSVRTVFCYVVVSESKCKQCQSGQPRCLPKQRNI